MMGKKSLTPKFIYSVTINELVPLDNFYRRVEEILDLRFVYQECKNIYGKTGKPSLDPVVFLKLVLFGYFENIISDRELIRRASDSLSVRYYLGYDLDEELPWHSTISRTRSIIPESVFEEIFNKIFNICVGEGLVDGANQSIDSTLVKANASLESLEKIRPKLELSDYIGETRKENQTEENKNTEEKVKLKINPAEEKARMEIVELPKRNKKENRKKCSNKDYVSKTDPDSKIARKPGKLTNLYYTTHYSTDSKSNIITEVQTAYSDQSDAEMLGSIVKRSEDRLRSNGLSIERVAADKNYCSGKNLRLLETKGIEPFIPTQKHPNTTGLIDRKEFEYDNKSDIYVCPNGKILRYRFTSKREAKVYTAKKAECLNCPIKEKCTSGKSARVVQHSIYYEEYERLAQRLGTKRGKMMKRLRQINTEPLFAEAKANHGLAKFMTRGIDKAKKNSIMIASVQNLKKVIKIRQTRIPNESAIKLTHLLNGFGQKMPIFLSLTSECYATRSTVRQVQFGISNSSFPDLSC